MTEQEREIKRVISYIRSCRNAGIDTTITIDKSRNHFILNALEEIQKYRTIGTVEECREAREKQRPIKPKGRYETRYIWDGGYCPICECGITSRWNFCQNCGQAISWESDNL